MTIASAIHDKRIVRRHHDGLMKRPVGEWLRVVAAFALVAGVMAALTLGQLAIAALFRWFLAG